MNPLMRKLLVLVCIGVCACMFWGGAINKPHQQQKVQLSYWIVYWDVKSGQEEYKLVKGKAATVSYFAAYFDKDNCLFIPEEVTKAKAENGDGPVAYLTFVNDKAKEDGTFIEKDQNILKNIFMDEISLNKHVNKIIGMAKQSGYDGIEIDYEQVWKEPSLRGTYLHFIDILYKRAESQGMKVRVVLEPSVDFSAGFPEGPEYVVMLYNLYGTHSGPGPKADEKFILSMLRKMESLPKNRAVAFSGGGCLWLQGKNGTFIDEAEAVRLVKAHAAEPKRDSASGALYFDYKDNGKQYTVWYADSRTLNRWMDIAASQGVSNVYVWRLGSNTDINNVGKE